MSFIQHYITKGCNRSHKHQGLVISLQKCVTESLSFVELEQKQHEVLLRKSGTLKAVVNEPQMQAFLDAFDLALQIRRAAGAALVRLPL